MDDETKIDSQIKAVETARERHTPRRPTGFITVSPISGHRTQFWTRMRMIWDWFWLSMTLITCVFSMLAGGLLATKVLIFIWEGLLSEHFS